MCSMQHDAGPYLLHHFVPAMRSRTDKLNFPNEGEDATLPSKLLIKLFGSDDPARIKAAVAAASTSKGQRSKNKAKAELVGEPEAQLDGMLQKVRRLLSQLYMLLHSHLIGGLISSTRAMACNLYSGHDGIQGMID